MSAAALTEDDFSAMSDEEFLRQTNSMTLTAPRPGESIETPVDDEDADPAAELQNAGNEAVLADGPAAEEEQPNAEAAYQPGSEEGQAGEGNQGSGEGSGGEEAAAPDYKALYEQVMGPIKANGTTFTPASPEEVVRLMQMGANYTKKMQAMQPHLKLLRTLEGKGLLSEDRINYLIDLSENNPQAIQKLLHDSKIDPLDVNTSEQPAYKPGNHTISDAQMHFQDVVTSVAETENGKETIRLINSTWDQASKQAVFDQPELLQVMTTQRANGIFAKITGEMERRRMLGDLPNLPFVHAYKVVGDDLHAKGLLVGSAHAPAGAARATQPAPASAVSNRPARPRSQAASQEQIRAVSSAPGSTQRSSVSSFDPLNMTDEQVMAITSRR